MPHPPAFPDSSRMEASSSTDSSRGVHSCFVCKITCTKQLFQCPACPRDACRARFAVCEGCIEVGRAACGNCGHRARQVDLRSDSDLDSISGPLTNSSSGSGKIRLDCNCPGCTEEGTQRFLCEDCSVHLSFCSRCSQQFTSCFVRSCSGKLKLIRSEGSTSDHSEICGNRPQALKEPPCHSSEGLQCTALDMPFEGKLVALPSPKRANGIDSQALLAACESYDPVSELSILPGVPPRALCDMPPRALCDMPTFARLTRGASPMTRTPRSCGACSTPYTAENFSASTPGSVTPSVSRAATAGCLSIEPGIAVACFDGTEYGDDYLVFGVGDELRKFSSPAEEEGWAYGQVILRGEDGIKTICEGWYPAAYWGPPSYTQFASSCEGNTGNSIALSTVGGSQSSVKSIGGACSSTYTPRSYTSSVSRVEVVDVHSTCIAIADSVGRPYDSNNWNGHSRAMEEARQNLEDAQEEPLLPAGWKGYTDPVSKKSWWWHEASATVSWEPP